MMIETGQIIILIGIIILLVGYMAWRIYSDNMTHKLAKILKKSSKPIKIKITEIKHSRLNPPRIECFVFEVMGEPKTSHIFTPKNFFFEITAYSVHEGDIGEMFLNELKPGSSAWLDLKFDSFWGYIGQKFA
jgi:hypothetical protein